MTGESKNTLLENKDVYPFIFVELLYSVWKLWFISLEVVAASRDDVEEQDLWFWIPWTQNPNSGFWQWWSRLRTIQKQHIQQSRNALAWARKCINVNSQRKGKKRSKVDQAKQSSKANQCSQMRKTKVEKLRRGCWRLCSWLQISYENNFQGQCVWNMDMKYTFILLETSVQLHTVPEPSPNSLLRYYFQKLVSNNA